MSWLTWRILKAHAELAGKGGFYQTHLPRNRPNSLISEDLMGHVDYRQDYHSRFARNEWSMIGFLEENGIPYGVYADGDLESDKSLLTSNLIIFPGHSEYWSAEMFNSFDRFVYAGGKVFIASGKPMAELIETQRNALLVLATPMSSQSIGERVGSAFTTSGAYTAAPFRVEHPGAWILDGTGLESSDIFGENSSNHANKNYVDTEEQSGASGLFTAKIAPGSSKFTRVARGLNSVGPADMVLKETEFGGWIFNASSETFIGASARDENVARIILNLLNKSPVERSPVAAERAKERK
jgi:hypothetical protein